jgi:hypothetical protein
MQEDDSGGVAIVAFIMAIVTMVAIFAIVELLNG